MEKKGHGENQNKEQLIEKEEEKQHKTKTQLENVPETEKRGIWEPVKLLQARQVSGGIWGNF